MRRAWLAILWGFALGLPARAGVWDVEIPSRPADNFLEAKFRLLIDESALGGRPLRGLLVLVPGWNGDGRELAVDGEWSAFARERDLGVVGVYLRSSADDSERPPYHIVNQGSGAAWVRAVQALAGRSSRPEVARVPWVIWGHSAGGQFGYGLACVYPERVAAFVAVKGGIYETPPNPRVREVPGVFVLGENDLIVRAIHIVEIFERQRREGALWAIVWEHGAGHEIGGSLPFARAFLAEAWALRSPSESGATLRVVDGDGDGVVGTRSSYELLVRRPVGPDALVRTVWLPGGRSASLWRELGGADSVERTD